MGRVVVGESGVFMEAMAAAKSLSTWLGLTSTSQARVTEGQGYFVSPERVAAIMPIGMMVAGWQPATYKGWVSRINQDSSP